MIDTLKSYLKESNKNLIEELIYVIEENNITTIDELIKLEDEQFTINNKVLNKQERIKYASEITLSAYWDYDGLTLAQINAISTLKESLTQDISDNEKIYNLIKLFDMTGNECLFLHEAYTLITNNKY